MRIALCTLVAALSACASTGGSHDVIAPSTASSRSLLEQVSSLAGTWRMDTPEGSSDIEYKVVAGGSAVHETMMGGTPEEMVNLYTVHGDGLNMTHYCAAGNQPHMRATSMENGRIAFESSGVSGREALDEHYMAEMTLVIVDADHIEQHWSGPDREDASQQMVFQLRRVR